MSDTDLHKFRTAERYFYPSAVSGYFFLVFPVAWVRAEAATDFTFFGVFGFDSSFDAVEATLGDVDSDVAFLAIFPPLSLRTISFGLVSSFSDQKYLQRS